MARIFTDGAEMGDILFWDASGGMVTHAEARSGDYSYRVYGGNGYKFFSPLSEFYARFAVRVSSNNVIMSWRNGATVIGSIRLNVTTNKVDAYVGGTLVASSSISVLADTWEVYEVHLKIADSGGRLEVKIGGVLDIDFTGDTKPSTQTTVDNIGGSGISGWDWHVDDIALNDLTGSVDNSWCGDGRVILLKPNANGDSSQLVGQDSDSTDNYLNVDEIPADSDTTYNQSSTLNEYDLYNLSNSSLSEVTILRIIPDARAKDTVAEGGLASLPISISGGGVYEGTDRALTTSYTRILGSGGGSGYLKNPYTNLDWTLEDLDNLQVGFKVRS